jgi:hypothetical protein
MAAFWAVFTFGGSGSALTAHGSLDLKQENQIQILIQSTTTIVFFLHVFIIIIFVVVVVVVVTVILGLISSAWYSSNTPLLSGEPSSSVLCDFIFDFTRNGEEDESHYARGLHGGLGPDYTASAITDFPPVCHPYQSIDSTEQFHRQH